MHALKIPFTGIFVGGIAGMCLYFIVCHSDHKRQDIIEATSLVILVKLLASPHSPWQAYVAIIFQALLAIILLSGSELSRFKVLVFAILTQLESAIQKVVLTLIIYGTYFFETLDNASTALFLHLGITYDRGIAIPIFVIYVILHLLSGIFLGIWLPKLDQDVQRLQPELADFEIGTYIKAERSKYKWFGTVVGLVLPLCLAWYFDQNRFVYIFFRVLCITILFIFVITPLIKYLLHKSLITSSRVEIVRTIMDRLPQKIDYYARHVRWANNKFSGIKKLRYILLALLCAAMQEKV
jgi:multisubunit Na+/H+ antiporter MnhG subunit